MMTPELFTFIVTLSGLFGLVIGSFLNVVIYRVPAGLPLTRESRCPNCDARVRWWQNVPIISWLMLRGRCAECKSSISVRYPLVEAATAISFATVAWFFVDAWAKTEASQAVPASALSIIVVAYLYFAALGIALTLIDIDTKRLPNSIVLPGYVVAIALFLSACALGAEWQNLLRAGIGMAAMYAFYFLIRVIRPDGMGGGDVKLAGLVGLYLGWLGWSTLAVGAFAAFLLGGVFGILLILIRRVDRRSAIPFGPWIIAGAWVGIFTGEFIGRLYGGLYAQ